VLELRRAVVRNSCGHLRTALACVLARNLFQIGIVNMEPIYIELWCQFAPTKDGKWSMRAWTERPDWMLPNAKYYLVRIPVPQELVSQETVIAEVKADE
jgi:hypothetical protein